MCMASNGCSDFTVKCKIGWVSRSSGATTFDTHNAVAWAVDLFSGRKWPICLDHIMGLPLSGWKYWKLLPIPGKEMPEEAAKLAAWVDQMHIQEGIVTAKEEDPMNRKEYQAAAAQVRNLASMKRVPSERFKGLFPGEIISHELVVREAFVTFFQRDNPRFDAEKFRQACNP